VGTAVVGAEDCAVGADAWATGDVAAAGIAGVAGLAFLAAKTTNVITISTSGPRTKYAGIEVDNKDEISIRLKRKLIYMLLVYLVIHLSKEDILRIKSIGLIFLLNFSPK
jgi:hypothetical protein